jgi:succinate dehydrogenase/fumarate reductase flavoprotein subunit
VAGSGVLEALVADVLVVGGGLAGTWAALAARALGASVILADKGYCGASGVAATAGVGHWMVPPDGEQRDAAVRERARLGAGLTDTRRQHQLLDDVWQRLPQLGAWGYPFASTDSGGRFTMRVGQSPHYLRFMRQEVRRRGVRILDHSPATGLLTGAGGRVVGAHGERRQEGGTWRVRASAVVLATGGCTWKSKSLGGDVVTGDGQLFAAEVGARLSGMEMSSFFGIVPAGTSMDKNGYYGFASFFDASGKLLEGALFTSRLPLLRASLEGQVYARFDRAPEAQWAMMRAAMPNFFMVMDKLGIDPFTQRFPIEFVLEGTVRGTGGVRVEADDCRTLAPGLYVAGDTASREAIVGAASGAGAPNAAWAVSSGSWAGEAAARLALSDPSRDAPASPAGRVGLVPAGSGSRVADVRAITRALQGELLPVDKNGLRTERGLLRSLSLLDTLWDELGQLQPVEGETFRLRECAAQIAMGRWAYRSALARTESRGMHTRVDHPDLDPRQTHRILCGGLDQVWTAVDPEAPRLPGDAEVAA